jgi:small neutral amino acid transporter SnatA (MarC family)
MLREVKMKAEFLAMSIMLAVSVGGALLFEMWKISLCQSGGRSLLQCIIE